MSPRPRKPPDAEVFAAAGRVMSRVRPADVTLAAIAVESGVTASALVQRYGSKVHLLVAMAVGEAARTDKYFRTLRRAHTSPLGALRSYARHFASADTPQAAARSLAYLLNEQPSPALRRPILTQIRATRAGLRDLLQAAVSAGELKPSTDVDALTRAVEAVLGGSLMTWAFHREGKVEDWVRADLEVLLNPYEAKARPR